MAGKPGKGGPAKAPRQTRQTVASRATEIVDGLMGKAGDVLDIDLSQPTEVAVIDPDTGAPRVDEDGNIETMWVGGNATTARWLVDRVYPKKGSVLPKQITAKVNSIEGVLHAAEQITAMVFNQEMSVDEAEGAMDYLYRYCQLRAFERIDELKLLVEQFEGQTAGALTKMEQGLVPQWGGLKDKLADAQPANKTPAE